MHGALHNPLSRAFQARRIGANQVLPSMPLPLDQTGPLQHPKMPRNRRQRHAKRLGQDRNPAFSPAHHQAFQNSPARGIRQRRKYGRYVFPSVNQGVKY